VLTRRYHGLLTAALAPPLGRTLLVAKLDEQVDYAGAAWDLATNRWADGTVAPHGYRLIQRFHLDGTTPVWTYALADALLEKRIWMEPGANTTYVRYRVLRAAGPLTLHLKALVNYRDYHATTRGDGWAMRIEPVGGGLRVMAFDGALHHRARGAQSEAARLASPVRPRARKERGLDSLDDHLHAGTHAELRAGASADGGPSVSRARARWRAAWRRRVARGASCRLAGRPDRC
jgi:hypothetical protein